MAYLLGKAVKYTSWLSFAIFAYHLVLIKKYKTPEDQYPTCEPVLRLARFIDWSVYDLRLIFTAPAMSKMLPDRLPGIPYPKVLVLNLKGTLVGPHLGEVVNGFGILVLEEGSPTSGEVEFLNRTHHLHLRAYAIGGNGI